MKFQPLKIKETDSIWPSVFVGFSIGFLLGFLLWRSGIVPKIISALLLFAAAGYMVDSFAHIVLSDYAGYADLFALVVFLPAFVGELSLCLWLIVKARSLGTRLSALSR